MRVEIVTDTYKPDINGVAMTLGCLVDGLRKLGHWVYVIHTGEPEGTREMIMKSVVLPGYPEVRVGLPAKVKLSKRWQKKRPDVVYVATESPLGVSAIKVARRMGIPVAAGFHTNFHKYLKLYRLGKVEESARRYLRRVHALANATIVPSEYAMRDLREQGYQRVYMLGRGVNTELYNPSKRSPDLRKLWGVREGAPVVLVVGRVAPEKNLELAMECFSRMQSLEPDLCCVVVGDGPEKGRLKRKYCDVVFSGARTGGDLARHYASADILLFPSETETFGNVLLEGMASGLICVAYDYAAAKQHVTHGVDGLKAPLGNRDEFIRQAESALELERYELLRHRALRTADRLSWDKVAKVFEGHLVELSRTGRMKSRARRQRAERKKLRVRTLFLSDIHLGTVDCKAREVVDVLKHVQCDRIVLNGDIIDGWALKRGSKWKNTHTRVVRSLLKKMEKESTEVVYLRGNHDDFLRQFMRVSLGRLSCVNEYLHEGRNGKRYLVLHGDGFDAVSSGFRWLAVLGSVGYDMLLALNRFYNKYRSWRGKEYYSMSKVVKGKVKSAVNFVSNYEGKLVGLARKRGCDGVICGHIHTPANEMLDGIHYLNSGDWVETMSCLLENLDGSFEVVYYDDFLQRTMRDELQFDVLQKKFVVSR